MGNTVKDILKNPMLLFLTLGHRGFFNWMDDEKYLKIAFKIRTGKKLDLNCPRTFNEKLQWLKLYNRRPEYTKMVDKYEAKKYISNVVGEQYVIPTLGVWDRFDDIDFEQLPNQFVLKCTHDSGGLIICKDKNKIDIPAIRHKMNKCLRHNFYWGQREWPYKNVRPRIIAEKYMEDGQDGNALTDYKFFCFNGVPQIMYICQDHSKNPHSATFDMDFNRINIRFRDPISNNKIEKPACFEKMREIAETLSKGMPFVRIDFYFVNGTIYIGEITFFHNSGFGEVHPVEWAYQLGSWIDLPTVKVQ